MKHWPHAPAHKLGQTGAYMVTAGTYGKAHFFKAPEKAKFLHDLLLKTASEFGWEMQAWSILSNHYHFIANTESDPASLKKLISKVHTLSARHINEMDGEKGRKVWHQYWDSHITFEGSYLARLNYVHYNPELHGVCPNVENYEWCSARWFQLNGGRSFVNTVKGMGTSRLNVVDDF